MKLTLLMLLKVKGLKDLFDQGIYVIVSKLIAIFGRRAHTYHTRLD